MTPIRFHTTSIGSAYTCSHFGPCNSLSCEMAPWRDWTSLTYMYGRSLWRGVYLWNTILLRFPVSNMAPVNVNKYLISFRNRVGHFFKLSGIEPKLRQEDAEVCCASIGYRFAGCQFCSFVYFNDDQETSSMYGFSNSWRWYPISARAPR